VMGVVMVVVLGGEGDLVGCVCVDITCVVEAGVVSVQILEGRCLGHTPVVVVVVVGFSLLRCRDPLQPPPARLSIGEVDPAARAIRIRIRSGGASPCLGPAYTLL
jgi:hypothetical protein